MEGERTGLFFEIVRLADEIRPSFVFLENVPGLRTRGLERVVREFSSRGYDCRWHMLSAQEVGAPHIRNRWFMLAANPNGRAFREQSILKKLGDQATFIASDGKAQSLANTSNQGFQEARAFRAEPKYPTSQRLGGWVAECPVCRVADGCAHRMDHFKALGNGVVPIQAREAFKSLSGWIE